MRNILYLFLFFIFFVENAFAGEVEWRQLSTQMDILTVPTRYDGNITIVRFNPKAYMVRILSSSILRKNVLSVKEWEEEYHFILAINTSMYARDNKTSIALLKTIQGFNNHKLSTHFGALFLANPIDTSLDSVILVDTPNVAEKDIVLLLEEYTDAVQNFRIIDSKRNLVWKSKNNPYTTISAVANDGDGNILFIHSQALLTPPLLGKILLSLPINIRTTMYTEGAGESFLYINYKGVHTLLEGRARNPFSFITGSPKIPNIFAVYPRHEKK
ncbi:MAG: hypothetical protein ACRCV3_01240 [Desulfovibrionaceae bacterium]